MTMEERLEIASKMNPHVRRMSHECLISTLQAILDHCESNPDSNEMSQEAMDAVSVRMAQIIDHHIEGWDFATVKLALKNKYTREIAEETVEALSDLVSPTDTPRKTLDRVREMMDLANKIDHILNAKEAANDT
jgi:hypothetical protein